MILSWLSRSSIKCFEMRLKIYIMSHEVAKLEAIASIRVTGINNSARNRDSVETSSIVASAARALPAL